MRAFVIDDSTVSRILLSTYIKQIEGAEVLEFDDPRVALDRLFEDPPDIVLVDQMMERMSGVEFVERARENRAVDSVPIVMVTSNERPEVRIAALQAGATDFIPKPFPPEETKARVRNLMVLRRASDPRTGMLNLAELLGETFERQENRSNQPSMRTASDRRVAAYMALMLQELGVPALARRILDVATTFDAHASGTEDRSPTTLDEAFGRIADEAGGRLDKAVVATLLKNREIVEQIYDSPLRDRDI